MRQEHRSQTDDAKGKSATKAVTVAHKDGATPDASEQLVDILEKFGMNHVCLANRDPVTLLLFNFPMIAGTQFDEMKLNLILKLCRLLQHRDIAA